MFLQTKEFVNHYKNLGYTHFYLYDNNDKNGGKFEDIIFEEIKDGLVTIINYRGFRGHEGGPQMDAYYNCYENYKKNCDWISFFDIDEYLILEPNNTSFKSLLLNERYKNCDGISINWKIFTDNHLLEYNNISIKERFKQEKKKFRERFTKLIQRTNIKYNLNKSFSTHNPWKNIKLCNTLGKRISPIISITPPSFNYMHLNHYYTKTISEFCNKLKRGNAVYNYTLNTDILKKKFNIFFMINEKTKEKVKIFNKRFNTTFKLTI